MKNRRIIIEQAFDWWQLAKGISIFVAALALSALVSIDGCDDRRSVEGK
jgi:hypothetical protein